MKALVVATVGGFIDFEKNDIKLLHSLGYEVTVACNTKSSERYLKDVDARIVNINFSRNPISSNNIGAYKQLKRLIYNEDYKLIHCHTPVAGVLTRIAAKKKSNCKVIYTAHGFHFYRGANLKNWVLFYPAEWICAHYTDILITINSEDYEIAKRKFKAKNIQYVPGVGLDMEKISHGKKDRCEVRNSLGLTDDDVMLFSVGELNKNKNHEIVIRAMKKLSNRRIHYFIAGNGELKDYLIHVAEECDVKENVHLLGYRTDIAQLDTAADIYCHPSFREGLSVALMEAIACGTNVVCSDIRGNRDLAADCENVTMFNPNDVNSVANTIEKCIDIQPRDNKGINKYSLKEVQNRMKDIYSKMEGKYE